MSAKYRLLENLDWPALHEGKFQLEVSDSYVILKPLKPGASLVILAQAVKSRPPKPQVAPNGQPAGAAVPDDDVRDPEAWRLAYPILVEPTEAP